MAVKKIIKQDLSSHYHNDPSGRRRRTKREREREITWQIAGLVFQHLMIIASKWLLATSWLLTLLLQTVKEKN